MGICLVLLKSFGSLGHRVFETHSERWRKSSCVSMGKSQQWDTSFNNVRWSCTLLAGFHQAQLHPNTQERGASTQWSFSPFQALERLSERERCTLCDRWAVQANSGVSVSWPDSGPGCSRQDLWLMKEMGICHFFIFFTFNVYPYRWQAAHAPEHGGTLWEEQCAPCVYWPAEVTSHPTVLSTPPSYNKTVFMQLWGFRAPSEIFTTK